MNKLIASLGIFAVASLNPAYAAPPAPLAVPAWSWTGFYVGVNVGGSWGRSETDANLSDPFFTGAVLFATPIDFNMNGVIGGGQIGYNWQSGTWVLGIEADIQGSGQKGSAFFTCSTVICNPRADQPETSMASATLEQRLQWFGTLRARAGATVYPWLLVYVTGGLAYGAIKSDSTLTGFTEVGPPAPPSAASTSTIRTGWTFGVGTEAQLSGNWTVKIEYLYMDLGTVNTSIANSLTGPPTLVTFNSRITDNIVRVGLNYKF